MNGCNNCRYCRCYPGDYWTPDDFECTVPDNSFEGFSDQALDAIFDRVWVDGEQWRDNEDPICPGWVEAPTPEDDYWERYAYEENRWDKDAG